MISSIHRLNLKPMNKWEKTTNMAQIKCFKCHKTCKLYRRQDKMLEESVLGSKPNNIT